MDKQQLKAKALEIIEQNKDYLIEIGRNLYHMPETGFREYRSSA